MKSIIFAAALMAGSSALAQEDMTTMVDEAKPVATEAYAMPSLLAAVQQPGNANPESDARGIAVISDPAMIPAGYNGTASTGVGGPLVDPATDDAAANDGYTACTREVTDNCLQTYERGHGPK
jgi:hypothetical protein